MGRFLRLAASTALVLAVAGAAPVGAAAPAKGAAMNMARIEGKPNLNGIWQVMNIANWNLEAHDSAAAPAAQEWIGAIGAIPAGVGVVEGGAIPYKPEALAVRDANRKDAPKLDPEAACYLPGIPRANYMSHPLQIIQGGAGDILIAYEYTAANRVIHMQKVEVPPIDTWMGTSYGAWEGDTLKVVTLGQDPGEVIQPGGATKQGVTWLDRSGNYLTGTATVTERFKLKDKDHILYEVTIDDPSIFTRPWKISMALYRNIEPNAELLDFRCVPFADQLLYGDLLKDKDKYPKK